MQVLLSLHETVIPNMMHPALLADFLTHSLDQGACHWVVPVRATGWYRQDGVVQQAGAH